MVLYLFTAPEKICHCTLFNVEVVFVFSWLTRTGIITSHVVIKQFRYEIKIA